MHLMEMSPGARTLALRAMRSVAAADGESPAETELIGAAGRLLEVDPTLGPVSVGELREAGLSPRDATRVVQAMILTALMDGAVSPEEVAEVRASAEALGVDEPRIANLVQLARGQSRLVWLDLARRSFAREVFGKALKHEGPRGVWKIVGPMLGRATDPDLARRYLALGELPEGAFGRAYFRFVVDNDLGFPGERWAVPESGVWHDCAHVLGGYGIEPAEEIQVVSFIAGFSRQDPFFWLFTITLQFHLGIKMSPYSAPERGLFEPKLILDAFDRGAAMTADLSVEGWDPWIHFERPLDEVRRAFGIRAPR